MFEGELEGSDRQFETPSARRVRMWQSADWSVFWIFVVVVGSHACSPQKDAVRLTCPEDIELVAGKNSASADVSWDADDFKVVSTHQIKGLYQTVPVHGASATFRRSFSEGRHFVEYKAVDSSGSHGECSFTVTVKVVRCPPLLPPPFGFIECDAPGIYGTRCAVTCVHGYAPVGPDPQCLEDGRWSYDLAYCRITACPDPGTPLHSNRQCSTSTHAHGSACEFDCFHGYQLLGNRRIVCQSVSNRTQWSDPTPVCQEIIPPKIETCPTSVVTHLATSGTGIAEVPLPPVLFRTASGAEAPFVCSHYGPRGSAARNFSIGVHLVECTAADPALGEAAETAKCIFRVRVKANPCRPLSQPINGLLLCSGSHGGGGSGGGGVSAARTSCRLFCSRGHVLPRPSVAAGALSTSSAGAVFECDRTGSWSPSSFVPSCVVPSRPRELKLPAEVLYHSSDCSNLTHQTELRFQFERVLLDLIRTHSACALTPRECIVDGVTTDCHHHHQMTSSTRRHRRGSSNRKRRRFVSETFARRRQRQRRRRHLAIDDRRSFRLSVRFHFATRLAPSGGRWPDEYHRASHRLYSVYDDFKRRLDAGTFAVSHRIRSIEVDELSGSVRDSPIRTSCDLGYEFNRDFLLCVPCGAGTYFNNSLDQCDRCPEGTRQLKQGQFHCN